MNHKHYLLPFSIILLLVSCSKVKPLPPAPEPPPIVIQPIPEPEPLPPLEQFPIKEVGWLPEYEREIKKAVLELDELLEFSQADMKSFCPAWSQFNQDERLQFYADLFYSMAAKESGYRIRAWFTENQGTDSVTKHQVRSEGLLQLSYQDPVNYQSYLKTRDPVLGAKVWNFCPFDFAKDKAHFLADIKAGKTSSERPRTIQDPYINLRCGVFIAAFVTKHSRPVASAQYDFRDAMGAYWSVMRYGTSPAYKGVRQAFVKRQPRCNVP